MKVSRFCTQCGEEYKSYPASLTFTCNGCVAAIMIATLKFTPPPPKFEYKPILWEVMHTPLCAPLRLNR